MLQDAFVYFVLRARGSRAWVRVKLFVWCGSIILLTEEEPSPKHLVYKQLFDTFKSILSPILNLLLSVARGHFELSMLYSSPASQISMHVIFLRLFGF